MKTEPVAELVLEQMSVGDASSLRIKWLTDSYPPVGTKLYTNPVKELTDEEIIKVYEDMLGVASAKGSAIDFARAILKKAQEQ